VGGQYAVGLEEKLPSFEDLKMLFSSSFSDFSCCRYRGREIFREGKALYAPFSKIF
jgi:hypothetical protein